MEALAGAAPVSVDTVISAVMSEARQDWDGAHLELVQRALKEVFARDEVRRGLTDAQLSDEQLEPGLKEVILAAHRELAPELSRVDRLNGELSAARHARSSAKGKNRVGTVFLSLLMVELCGLIVIGVGGVGGLVVTAINGHAHWIFPWFGVGRAAIAAGAVVVLTIIGGILISDDKADKAAADKVAEKESALSGGRQRLVSTLAEQWVLPHVTKQINDRLKPSYGTQLAMEVVSGLGEPVNPRFEVPTAARAVILRRFRMWQGGSLGLAGPRGVGKSTLIDTVSRRRGESYGPRTLLPVRSSAPVKYESRAFMLHLFSSLCELVLEVYGLPPSQVADLLDEPSVARRVKSSGDGSRSSVLRAATRIGRAAQSLPSSHRGDQSDPTLQENLPRVVVRALSDLNEIRFQQTHTAGWGGSLTAPIGSLNLNRGQSLVRTPLSVPDIVNRFKDFVASISDVHLVVVAIDELDKIASADEANQFLNDIKGLFEAQNCFFLLSVSEEAMSAFERRGLPTRDAIDSALDDVITLDYMNFLQTAKLLGRRVVGLPRPFIALCHVLGGGLPRDVLRVGRRLAEMADNSAGRELKDVVRELAAEDLNLKLRAAEIASRNLDPTAGFWVRDVTQRLKSPDADAIFSACAAVGSYVAQCGAHLKEGGSAQLVADTVSYAYFLASAVAFFTGERDDDAWMETLTTPGCERSVETLARARQAFESDPQTAWETTSRFRCALGYDELPYPLADATLTSQPGSNHDGPGRVHQTAVPADAVSQ